MPSAEDIINYLGNTSGWKGIKEAVPFTDEWTKAREKEMKKPQKQMAFEAGMKMLSIFGGPKMAFNLNRHGINPYNHPRFNPAGKSLDGRDRFEFNFNPVDTPLKPKVANELAALAKENYQGTTPITNGAPMRDVIDFPDFWKAAPESEFMPLDINYTSGPRGGAIGWKELGHKPNFFEKMAGAKSKILGVEAHANAQPELYNTLAHEFTHYGQRLDTPKTGGGWGARDTAIPPEILKLVQENPGLSMEQFNNIIPGSAWVKDGMYYRPGPKYEAYLRNGPETEARAAGGRSLLRMPERKTTEIQEDIPRNMQWNDKMLKMITGGSF